MTSFSDELFDKIENQIEELEQYVSLLTNTTFSISWEGILSVIGIPYSLTKIVFTNIGDKVNYEILIPNPNAPKNCIGESWIVYKIGTISKTSLDNDYVNIMKQMIDLVWKNRLEILGLAKQ